MAIKHRALMESQRTIDLDGPDGNAIKVTVVNAVIFNDNYIHLVRTFDKHFGDYFTLYTKQVDILKTIK